MYVRTKDYRIIVVEDKLYNDNGKMRYQYKGSPALIKQSNVIKASENIEELCDEVVIVNKEKKGVIFHEDMFFKTPQEARGKCECYGAIWTDKGLLYVARMNDKGVLELL